MSVCDLREPMPTQEGNHSSNGYSTSPLTWYIEKRSLYFCSFSPLFMRFLQCCQYATVKSPQLQSSMVSSFTTLAYSHWLLVPWAYPSAKHSAVQHSVGKYDYSLVCHCSLGEQGIEWQDPLRDRIKKKRGKKTGMKCCTVTNATPG